MQRTNNAIETVIKEVSRLSKLHSAILFGSVARDETDRLSDIDLLIVCKDEFKIRKAVYDLDPPLDVSIYSPNEMILMAGLGLPFIHHLAKEGIVLLDDGTFKNVLSNLRETDKYTLKLLVSEAKDILQKCSFLSEFKPAYVVYILRFLINLIEADLCFHGYEIFDKSEAIQKFIGLHPELSSFKETLLILLDLYRNYTRNKGVNVQDVNVSTNVLFKKIEQIIEIVEHEV